MICHNQSVRHLKNLKDIDLSHSPIITVSKSFAKLEHLEYLNLAFSSINKRSAIEQFGKEYMGGSMVGSVYEEKGAEKAVDELFALLKSLKNLKAVNMASQDPLSQTADLLDRKLSQIGKPDVVKYSEHSRWKD